MELSITNDRQGGPSFDLRPLITKPVVLGISRSQVETGDITSVLAELKSLPATR